MMGMGFHGGGIVWMLFIGVVVVVPFWKICSKAGYPGALSLLILVPLVNVGLLYFLGFASWPSAGERSRT